MRLRFVPAAAAVAAAVLLLGCGRSNNLLLGRVQATVGSHTVVVTDCYRTQAPQPERLADEGGLPVYRYMPCRDADIRIRGGDLTVNGKPYGHLNGGDAVLVDHGVVSVGRWQAER
jgi:hypothetical protein